MYLPRRIRTPTVWIVDADTHAVIGEVEIRDPKLDTIDAVARICCAAKQRGVRPRLRGSSKGFYELLDLAGLVGAVDADGQPQSSVRRSGNPNSANNSGPM